LYYQKVDTALVRGSTEYGARLTANSSQSESLEASEIFLYRFVNVDGTAKATFKTNLQLLSETGTARMKEGRLSAGKARASP
jgi:hypothetical protein